MDDHHLSNIKKIGEKKTQPQGICLFEGMGKGWGW
jgi:hypothetical protein